jgi:hypothetical protein
MRRIGRVDVDGEAASSKTIAVLRPQTPAPITKTSASRSSHPAPYRISLPRFGGRAPVGYVTQRA